MSKYYASMNAAYSPPIASAAGIKHGITIGQRVAPIVPLAAVLYNFLLCFVNTKISGIGPSIAVAAEIVLIGIAIGLVWNRSSTMYAILLLLAAYFYAVMVYRSEFDPKIIRDILIPIVFFFLGCSLGTLKGGDRLVTILILITLGAALFEWLAVDTYVRYFDVSNYYIARGTADADQQQSFDQYNQGFFNSTRFDNRTLLPFLGNHRVSGIFLEAPSVGNFAAIAFAWVLLRDRQRFWALIAKTFILVALVALADARFGLYFSIFTLLLPLIRPTALFVAPFLAMAGLVTYAGVAGNEAFSNDMLGRFSYAGEILSGINSLQVFGLQVSDITSGVRFASDPVTDSAYTYLIVKFGILGAAAIWALFIYSPAADKNAARFKTVIAFYYILALTIAASVFTIKTAALLWFLYGTLNNPHRDVRYTAYK